MMAKYSSADFLLFIPENDPSPCQVVRAHFNPNLIARQNTDVMHPHLSGNGCQNFVAILQFHLKHGVTKRLDNGSVLFN